MKFSNRQHYSRENDRFVMFLKRLLVYSVVLTIVGATGSCRSTLPHPETLRQEAQKKSPGRYLSSPEECLRECKTGELPKTCYWHFTLEWYPVLGGACQLCTPSSNNSRTGACQCVLANGVEKTMLAVNRMFPGPSIQVCEGDSVVVDVLNSAEGQEVAIHWHGLFQRRTPYADGVPFLTQCPIAQGTTFRYQYYADNDGTHFWHAHTGLQKQDGVVGTLIVKKPKDEEPNCDLYDYDLPEHVIIINDWMNLQANERLPGTVNIRPGQEPDSFLINGRGQYTDPITGNRTTTPSEVFFVKPGGRYRLRIIHGGCTTCPVTISIQNHTLRVIALDGIAVKQRDFTAVVLVSGQRFDCVMHANQASGGYWMHVRGDGECATNSIHQTALFQYEGITSGPISAEPTYDTPPPPGIQLNSPDGDCSVNQSNVTCIHQMESANPVDSDILKENADYSSDVGFQFVDLQPNSLYQPHTYDPFLIPPGGNPVVAVVDGITFASPPSPPLSQYGDLPSTTFCNETNLPKHCRTTCRCMNVISIPLNSVMEFPIIDEIGVPGLMHPFHLHGHAFHVVAMGKSPYPNVTKISRSHVRLLDEKKLISRRLKAPPAVDVIPIPTNGYAVIRFRADNPGWWLFHCHFLWHIVNGMSLVFRVGTQEDLPPIPANFPRCGNWLPPIAYDKN